MHGDVMVLNLQGRVFMPPIDCPFREADKRLLEAEAELGTPPHTVLVDFHAEATSEKQGLGWYLDGRVSAVVGTHTHVGTADCRILPGGTAYVSDLGMTGPVNSVIGTERAPVLERFRHRTAPAIRTSFRPMYPELGADRYRRYYRSRHRHRTHRPRRRLTPTCRISPRRNDAHYR